MGMSIRKLLTDKASETKLTVTDILSEFPEATQNLTTSFPDVKLEHVVVNIVACTTVSHVVAPAPAHIICTTQDTQFSTLTTVVPSSSRRHTSLLFLRDAHLVGKITVSLKGFLRFQTSSAPFATPILIAPTPPPHIRDVPVYISDWRHLPVDDGGPLLEVLLKDVHPLLPPAVSTVPYLLSRSVQLPTATSFAISGVVAAKSQITGPRMNRSFIIELVSSESDVAIMILFSGSSISWWPFIPIRNTITVTKVHQYKRMRESKRPILAVSSETTVHTGFVEKKYTLSCSSEWSLIRSIASGSLVDYDGIVSHHLSLGSLLLDGAVVLHLAEFDICVAGRIPALAFRPGTHIRASHLIAIARPTRMPHLFATARTTIDVLYFGDVRKVVSPRPPSLWIQLCSRLSLPRVVVAEELFDVLIRKFHSWFSTDISHLQRSSYQASNFSIYSTSMSRALNLNDGLVAVLLGDGVRPGLIQSLMLLLGDSDEILQAYSFAIRNVNLEFLTPVLHTSTEFAQPCIPTLAHVREALSLLCADIARKGTTRMLGTTPALHAVFDDDDVARKLAAATKTPGVPGVPVGVALLGMLQGVADGRGIVRLTDSTDALDVRCIPSVSPSLLGAMVFIQRFNAVVDVRDEIDSDTHQTNRSLHVTLLCEEENFKVIVDGPCVQMQQGTTQGATPQSQDLTADVRSNQQAVNIFTQSIVFSERHSYQDSVPNVSVVDVPLVCIFIEKISRSITTCILIGRLVATIPSRKEDAWTVVDCDGRGFWTCHLFLEGQSLLSMASCFTEGCLFAVSCTELEGIPDARLYIFRKATHSYQRKHPLRLRSELESVLPWVENLGCGVYMRFIGNESNLLNENELLDLRSCQDSCVSQEGEQYIYVSKAVEQFRKEVDQQIETKLWHLFEWKDKWSLENEKVMSACGIVSRFESTLDDDLTSTDAKCSVDKLTIAEETLGLFSITICFYNNYALVRGIKQGMRIAIRNFVRVPVKSKMEHFSFVANARTSVSVLSIASSMNIDESTEGCVCNNRFEKGFETVGQELKMIYIDEFMGCGNLVAGLIRFGEVQVEWLHLQTSGVQSSCDECGVTDDKNGDEVESVNIGRGRSVLVDMVVQIDDGSRSGLLRCSGFGLCARLVRANQTERLAMKRLATIAGNIQVDVADGPRAFYAQLPYGMYAEARALWGVLNSSRTAPATAVVLNRAFVSERTDGRFTRLVPNSYKFGYGRTVVIARPPLVDRVMLDCISLFEESSLLRGTPHSEREAKNHISPLTLLRKLMDEDK